MSVINLNFVSCELVKWEDAKSTPLLVLGPTFLGIPR